MSDYRLRNHIPISGPATREPLMGDEPDLRVSLGFTPRWYYERLGIDFSERWHTDPVYRYETLIEMKTYLHGRFPSIPYFKPQYEDGVERTCATISGVYGIKIIPMAYGLDILYKKDDWPDNLSDQHLTKEQIEGLELFDLEKLPVVRQLLGQMDIIEEKWGQIHGYLNYQGILNAALKVRGNEIFMDMYDNPDFVHNFFEHIANTIMGISKLVQERQRNSGFYVNLLSMSNCVMNMISPDMYNEFVLPYDIMLSNEYERFGVHTCNWDVTPYIDVLRSIEKMGYLDMGIMSDMKRVREAFPNTRRAVLYSPVDLEQKPVEMIRKDIEKIYLELAPCDIVMADITNTTPDEKITRFLSLVSEFS